MKSVLYLGCPAHERPTTEKLLGAANVSVVWADDVTYALSELERRDLPVLLDLSRGDADARLETGSGVHAASGTLKQARAQFEREYIAAVLDRHRGRISEAARALGLQRTNLYRKMRALRVNRERRR